MNSGPTALIAALYRILDDSDGDHGARAWFIRQLYRVRGVQISKATMSNWTKNGVPDSRAEDVEETLKALHRQARARLIYDLDQLQDAYDRRNT